MNALELDHLVGLQLLVNNDEMMINRGKEREEEEGKACEKCKEERSFVDKRRWAF